MPQKALEMGASGFARLAPWYASLLQCFAMTNWRQIQARIRKAKNSPEALRKLEDLFEKTRDAMVAFEMGVLQEKAGQNEESVRWYSTAAQRFRRAEWKKKAEDALTRLGAPVPATNLIPESRPAVPEVPLSAEESPEAPADVGRLAPVSEAVPAANEAGGAVIPSLGDAGQHRRRRRGRRGGRGRHRKGSAPAPALPAQSFAEPVRVGQSSSEARERPPQPSFERASERPPERFSVRSSEPARAAQLEPEPPALPSERTVYGRAGEPALASRLVHLEALLRRLVSGPLHRLDEAEEAPAGPGVFLLSDSDLVTSYYVEACQTLRIGLGHLLRGGRGGRVHPGGSLRARLAEHLGISESKVGDYMKKHCVVRWVQLDDEAPHFAHFAIGVLRTPLNAE